MALAPCLECGKEISTEAATCPNCGAKPKRPGRTKWWLWIPLALVGGFFTLGAIGMASPEAQEQARARDAIDMCWDEQKRPSLDPGTARFVASSCEMMESKYEQKYGRRP